ncbi:TadE/TadG family type IV pilus assembly protein [Sphingomonas adhaesiva]|uniref:TadE/TadG family type IV pilus assembly protein n=1 Tax=Sphingomonas adhaesiva TaxID=28212 RepID=UPI002FFC2BDD
MMRHLSLPRPSLSRRLARDTSGVAMTEFALALVFMLPIALTGVEVGNLAVTVLRLNQIAMMAADNVARVRATIDENDINEVMTGVRFAGENIKFGDQGRVIVSTVEDNGQTGANAGYKITWQRCFGKKNVTSAYGVAGDGATNSSMATGMGPSTNKIRPVSGSALAFAEVRYTYQPLVGTGFMPTMELSAIQSFTVRDRASQTLTNISNLTDAQRRLCDAAHLSAT